MATALTWALPVAAIARPQSSPEVAPASESGVALSGFVHRSVVANGVRLHYVTAGRGEPVLLIPGWPQSWYAWRHVMRELAAAGRQAVAIDPRGFGDSDKPDAGYDLATSAKDIHAFINAAGLARAGGIDVVSHDVGTWIAYAHAHAYPSDVRRLVGSESVIPWTTPAAGPPDDATNVKAWHFGFNRLDDLPEMLIAGRERSYLTWLFANKSTRTWTINGSALDEYVRVFTLPGAARAGFDYYRRSFDATGRAQMQARIAKPLTVPMLAIGAEGGLGGTMLQRIRPLATNVRGEVLAGCGHYLPDECPTEFTRAVREFWRRAP